MGLKDLRNSMDALTSRQGMNDMSANLTNKFSNIGAPKGEDAKRLQLQKEDAALLKQEKEQDKQQTASFLTVFADVQTNGTPEELLDKAEFLYSFYVGLPKGLGGHAFYGKSKSIIKDKLNQCIAALNQAGKNTEADYFDVKMNGAKKEPKTA